MKTRDIAVLFAFSTALSVSALAAVSAEEAKQLGGPILTQFGAEKAGNKEGTIPAYTGDRIPIPASYDPKESRRLPNPFANEKPLYSITAQNMDQYANKLSEGQKKMLKEYPGFRMDIFPTHRTMTYPQYALDNTLKNATNCKAANNGLRMEGCLGGVPFPIPKTGNEVMWNHEVAFTYRAVRMGTKSWLIEPNGTPVMLAEWDNWQEVPFIDESIKTPPDPSRTLYYLIRANTINPVRKVGEIILIHDALDNINPGRRIWQYIPGQRRVKLAPDLAYDTPSVGGGGGSTMDENFVFMGALDRYDFKLVGKKESYLMYNSYDQNDYKKCPENVLFKAHFPNPDCLRWELHRTWVVEATLKPGFRHIYPRRVMYFDEDTPGAGQSDNFDASGSLYRYSVNNVFIGYNSSEGAAWHTSCYAFDLRTGGWNMSSLFNYPGGGLTEVKPQPLVYYSPEAAAGGGVR